MSRKRTIETQNVPRRRNPLVDSADLLREDDEFRESLVPPAPDFSALVEPLVDEESYRNIGPARGDDAPAPEEPRPDPVGIVTKVSPSYETDPDPTPPDAERILAKGHKAADRRARAAMLWDAGDTIAAGIANRKEDPDYLNRLLQQAKAPEARARETLSTREKAYEALKAKHAISPASKSNRSVQDLVLKSELGEALGGEEVVRGLNDEQLQKWSARWQAMSAADRQRALDAAAAKRQAAQDQLDREKFDETKRHNAATEEAAMISAKKPPALPWSMNTDIRTPIDERGTAENAIKLGNATAGMAQFDNTLRQLEQLMPGITEGAGKGKLPDGTEWDISKSYGWNTRLMDKDPTGLAQNMMSPEAKKFLPVLKQAMEILTRDRTGAVINDSEFLQQQEQWATKVAEDPTQLPVAIRTLKNLFHAKLKAKQLGFKTGRTSPWEMWKQGGGIAFDDPFYAAQNAASAQPEAPAAEAPPVPTDVPVREPGGAPVPFRVPEERVKAAKALLKPGQVLAITSEGKLRGLTAEQVPEAQRRGWAIVP